MAKTIVIDPGHGGYDSGCTNASAKEKDITLAIGLGLKTVLEAAGVNVVMTREDDSAPGGLPDKNHELEARCQIARDANADLFLSIHVNAGGGNGAELYVYQDGGSIHGIASGIIANVGNVMGYHGEPIKDGSMFYVIRNTPCPAMLLEVGFIDSSDLDKIQTNLTQFPEWIAAPLIPWLDGNPDNQTAPLSDIIGVPKEMQDAIDFVKGKGWMVGPAEGQFAPNDSLTRGQLAIILHRIFGG